MQLSDVIAGLSLLAAVLSLGVAAWAIWEAKRAFNLAQNSPDQERRNTLRAALVPASEHSVLLLTQVQAGVALFKGNGDPFEKARGVLATQQHVYQGGAATERLGKLLSALQRTVDTFREAFLRQETSFTPRFPDGHDMAGFSPELQAQAARAAESRAAALDALDTKKRAKVAETRAAFEAELTALVPALEQELAALLVEDREKLSKPSRKQRRITSK